MTKKLNLLDENVNPIFEEIKCLINSSRAKVYSVVNTDEKILFVLSNFDNSVDGNWGGLIIL